MRLFRATSACAFCFSERPRPRCSLLPFAGRCAGNRSAEVFHRSIGGYWDRLLSEVRGIFPAVGRPPRACAHICSRWCLLEPWLEAISHFCIPHPAAWAGGESGSLQLFPGKDGEGEDPVRTAMQGLPVCRQRTGILCGHWSAKCGHVRL